MKQFSVILATDKDDRLGVNGKLPWNSPEDMEYFREMTSFTPFKSHRNILICGRKTWESFGRKVLPGRILYVITSNPEQYKKQYPNISFFCNFHEAVHASFMYPHVYKVWIIGGKSIYLQAFNHPNCGDIYWNRIGKYEIDDKVNEVTTLSSYHFHSHTSNCITTSNIHPSVTCLVGKYDGLEIQYMRLMNEILYYGESRPTRNAPTLSLFDRSLQWDMRNGFPLLTTKRMFWKGIVEELLFFIRGETQTKQLEAKGVRIWQGNTTRDFLDGMGFTKYEEGEMGPMYGYQWRHFNKPYITATNDQKSEGIDQLKDFIQEIKSNPNSRRHLLTTYNPAQVHEGVLYPCHSLVIQGYVSSDKRLSLKMYQRSADVFLGLPFNIASTSLLCVMISKLCGLDPGHVSITLGDAHIYEAHVPACRTQLSRECYPLPTLRDITFDTLEDIEKSSLEDYVVQNYTSHPRIPAPMFA